VHLRAVSYDAARQIVGERERERDNSTPGSK
jgi:hypothetical protein